MGFSPLIRTMWIACAVAIISLTFAARSESSLSRMMRSMFEPLALFVRDEILEPIFGRHAGHYLPYFLTLFFFLLTCNLLGLVPHMSGVTANPWVTAGMAISYLRPDPVRGSEGTGTCFIRRAHRARRRAADPVAAPVRHRGVWHVRQMHLAITAVREYARRPRCVSRVSLHDLHLRRDGQGGRRGDDRSVGGLGPVHLRHGRSCVVRSFRRTSSHS